MRQVVVPGVSPVGAAGALIDKKMEFLILLDQFEAQTAYSARSISAHCHGAKNHRSDDLRG